MKSTISEFIADRWVSWLMELAVLLIVAYFAISETRKTAEQTREMLKRYDTAISAFAAERTKAVDSAAASAYDAARSKAKSISREDLIEALKALKADKTEK
jgi:hypothetical protein